MRVLHIGLLLKNESSRKTQNISEHSSNLYYTDVRVKTKLNKKLIRTTDISYQVVDSKKFKKHTGWKEKINFKDLLKTILNYFDKKI